MNLLFKNAKDTNLGDTLLWIIMRLRLRPLQTQKIAINIINDIQYQ